MVDARQHPECVLDDVFLVGAAGGLAQALRPRCRCGPESNRELVDVQMLEHRRNQFPGTKPLALFLDLLISELHAFCTFDKADLS